MAHTVMTGGGGERGLVDEGEEGCVTSPGASVEVLRSRDWAGLPDVELTTAEERRREVEERERAASSWAASFSTLWGLLATVW